MVEIDWFKIEDIKWKSKTGHPLSPEEFAIVEQAYKQEPIRYRALEEKIARRAKAYVNPSYAEDSD